MSAPRIGCHVSIRRGYREAAVAAGAIGGSAFQYFPKNPRSLGIKAFDRTDAERCAAYCRLSGIASIAHAPYPTNLAAADEGQRRRTVESLRNDLEIADACGSLGVVVHFGIYKGGDILQGYRNIIRALDETLDGWRGNAKLLLENQAGDHADMGTTFEELAQIRKLSSRPECIAYCLDTCHLFAAGVWDGRNTDEWLERARMAGYLEQLAAVHLNDSAYGSGSRRDRHAALGRGAIGEQALLQLLGAPEIRAVPLILETPEPEGFGYAEQLQLLAEWCSTADSAG